MVYQLFLFIVKFDNYHMYNLHKGKGNIALQPDGVHQNRCLDESYPLLSLSILQLPTYIVILPGFYWKGK